MPTPLLDVQELRTHLQTEGGLVRAVEDVSFTLEPGQTLGLVGESGSGKSMTSLSLMGLLPATGKVVHGHALFHGQDLLKSSERAMRKIRGRHLAMIFQDPMTALNPFLTIGEQMTEVTRLHLGWSARKARDQAVALLETLGLANVGERILDYPHQFSGGMRQRVVIAMALSCQPEVLIADEPTTALDVTIQAQILELLKKLQQEHGTAILLITHDLGVIANMCEQVKVMYGGRIVESAPVRDLFARPLHPYTHGLLQSIPRIDDPPGKRLTPIEGQPPDLTQLPPGCAFAPRCRWSEPACLDAIPPLVDAAPLVEQAGGRQQACRVQANQGIDWERPTHE